MPIPKKTQKNQTRDDARTANRENEIGMKLC